MGFGVLVRFGLLFWAQRLGFRVSGLGFGV